jgi:hypothetical protein
VEALIINITRSTIHALDILFAVWRVIAVGGVGMHKKLRKLPLGCAKGAARASWRFRIAN